MTNSRRSGLLILSMFALLMCGCPAAEVTPQFPQFVATTKSQRAVFLTEGWTGGGGDPVQTELHGRTQKLRGRPVYLLFEEQMQVKKGMGKQPEESNGSILIDAQIHLEPTSVSMTSVPGGGSKAIYRVVIEKLFSSSWYLEK